MEDGLFSIDDIRSLLFYNARATLSLTAVIDQHTLAMVDGNLDHTLSAALSFCAIRGQNYTRRLRISYDRRSRKSTANLLIGYDLPTCLPTVRYSVGLQQRLQQLDNVADNLMNGI
jgi:hypothetical protein